MDKKKRNAPGTITVDEVKLEGGITIPILLSKESGIFRARIDRTFEGHNTTHHESESWEDKDLDKVRTKIHQWHKDNVKLDWEPLIVLFPGGGSDYRSRSENVLGSCFERMMRAKKLTSENYEWRSWAFSKPDGGFVYAHDLDVYPPGGKEHRPEKWRSNETDPVIIPYTPERWTALLQLVKMENALRERLAVIMQSDEMKLDLFFRQVTGTGLLAFSGLKIKEDPDA